VPDILATGASALLAFQRALDTTGHNIANVATDGYSRQRVLLASRPGQELGGMFFGAGVQLAGVERLSDRFIFDRMLESLSAQSRLSRFSAYADRLDGWLSNADTGLAQPLQKYFDALQGLAADPSSTAARTVVLSSVGTLVSRFRSLQGQLDATAADIGARLTQAAGEASELASRVAQLNQEIVRAQATTGGRAPNDLLDQREQLLSQLAQRIGITTVTQDDGAVNVFTAGGQALVVGTTAGRLATVADPYDARRLDLALDIGGSAVRISGQAGGGEIGGLLDFRREVLDPAMGELGRLAATLAASVNAQHAAGVDAYGAAGGNFFIAPQPQAAAAATNAGSGTVAAAYGNLSQLSGHDYRMGWDGAAWSFTDVTTGASVTPAGTGTAGDPFVFGGLSVVVSGVPAAGDSFLLRPTAAAAGQVGVAITDPNRIAAAGPGAGPGSSDNANARLLGALSTAPLLDGGTASLNAAYGALVARAGGAAQQAGLQLQAQDAVHAQVVAGRESVSGVNLDEEAANLVRFQQAYQAAAQVIATANSLFESLLAAVRR
jgi:flagellar hook-associated protein 1